MALNILVIKNISPQLSYNDRDVLFRQFGAQSTTNRPHHSFAVFADEFQCRQAMTRLHQLSIFGLRLRVEFADNPNITGVVSQQPAPNQPHIQKKLAEENTEAFKEQKLRQFLSQLDYVSPNLGLNYLPSPLLLYHYPPATPEIVARIGRILLRYPRFYTQVLHLMNKMSLPTPFESSDPSENIADIARMFAKASSSAAVRSDLSSGESELDDSDQEIRRRIGHKFNHKWVKSAKKSVKKLKTGFVGEKADYLPKDFKPKSERKHKTTEEFKNLFDSPKVCVQKQNIPVNIVSDYNKITQMTKPTVNEVSDQTTGFGLISAQTQQNPIKTTTELVCDKNDLISDEELANNLLPTSQWSQYSVFKNYSSGEPSVRLYLKNVDKSVEQKDLIRIFGKFIDWESNEQRNMFDVQLMKSGRMKGQAFVTLANEMSAQRALNQTNGYLINGKPIVVAFARSRKPQTEEHLPKS